MSPSTNYGAFYSKLVLRSCDGQHVAPIEHMGVTSITAGRRFSGYVAAQGHNVLRLQHIVLPSRIGWNRWQPSQNHSRTERHHVQADTKHWGMFSRPSAPLCRFGRTDNPRRPDGLRNAESRPRDCSAGRKPCRRYPNHLRSADHRQQGWTGSVRCGW